MFFASNTILETLYKTALDASYNKGKGFKIMVLIHPDNYNRLLKELYEVPDIVNNYRYSSEGKTPRWVCIRESHELIFVRSFDISIIHTILVEDGMFHTLTILHGEEKNTLP